MFGISKEVIERLRAEYPVGAKVELVKMNDPYRRMPPGIKGEVIGVDDIGTIHVSWETGSQLGIAYGEDSCRRIR